MKRKSRYRRTKKKSRFLLAAAVPAAAAAGAAIYAAVFFGKGTRTPSPEELLVRYMDCIPGREYGQMYEMLNVEASADISREDFIRRNEAIYEGIEVRNMEIEITAYDKKQLAVSYRTSFDTAAGNISFENEAFFRKGEEGYELVWDDSLIFPNLDSSDKVRVSVIQAARGGILDRNGSVLAGKGTASSVGIVPGKLENRDEAIPKIAELLKCKPETIEKKLAAKWVKEDYFVPIQTIPKVQETERLTPEPDEGTLRELERQEKLLAIPGVMLSDTQVRAYPAGEAAAHLTGYVQSVTAEDLEKHTGEGYTAGSVIGRTGMESLFEKELRGQNGCTISITDAAGNEKEVLACIPVRHGKERT